MPDRCQPDMVADFMLIRSRERGEILTNLKLQKLIYYAQAWFLAIHDEELFSEDFQAWVHGPVCRSQYNRFKKYTWKPILDEVDSINISDSTIVDHLDEIIRVFGNETATALEQMTHQEQPWREARGDLPPDEPSNDIISKDVMKSYCRSLQE